MNDDIDVVAQRVAPIQGNAEAIKALVGELQRAAVVMTQAATAQASAMMAPKRIVRDPMTGKAIGIEVVK